MNSKPREVALLLSTMLLIITGCTRCTDSVQEKNKALVRRFAEAVNARQYDVIDELVAPNFVRHCPATPDVNVTNREQFKEYLKQDAAVFPDSRQTGKLLVAEGDLVGFWCEYEGTQLGQMGPFSPSGKKMKDEFAGIFRVENGRLAELWVTWDNLAALMQLGHFPPPAGKGE